MALALNLKSITLHLWNTDEIAGSLGLTPLNGAIASYSSGGSDDRPVLPFQPLLLNHITIRGVLVYTMPDEAKQMALRDITTALEEDALRHNIAQRFSINEVAAAHETQDSGKMIGIGVLNN